MHSYDPNPDQTFLRNNNYDDPTSSKFGQSALSLGNVQMLFQGNEMPSILDCGSWTSFLFLPTTAMNLDTSNLSIMPRLTYTHENQNWFQTLPHVLGKTLDNSHPTTSGLAGYFQSSSTEIESVLRIEQTGEFELLVPDLYQKRAEGEFFSWVTTTGYLWQLIYFVKALYSSVGYEDDTRIVLCQVSTNSTRLVDFSTDWYKPYGSIFAMDYGVSNLPLCTSPNIYLEEQVNLEPLSDAEIQTLVYKIARGLGHFYELTEDKFLDKNGEFPSHQHTSKTRFRL